ncbi:hypothetical protein EPN90_00615 [Patescibacteria group bacterium]|nr:MAG: hypothetical protein EPN90_00615 [Patescibacteria group bacterium]
MPLKKGGKRSVARKTRPAVLKPSALKMPSSPTWLPLRAAEFLALTAAVYLTLALGAALALAASAPRERQSLAPESTGEVTTAASAEILPTKKESLLNFILTPSRVVDGWTRVAASEQVTVIGSAPGADKIELVFTPAGTETAAEATELASGRVASDGSWTLAITPEKNMLGYLQVIAAMKDDTVLQGPLINFAVE